MKLLTAFEYPVWNFQSKNASLPQEFLSYKMSTTNEILIGKIILLNGISKLGGGGKSLLSNTPTKATYNNCIEIK